MEDNLELDLYILTENSYVKKMKEKDPLNFNEKDIFPYDWYKYTNYKEKIEILTEAIDKNILIKDTSKYKN